MEDYTTRIFKYNIHVFFYRYHGDSMPYRIKAGKKITLPGLFYSFFTICLGFWGVFGSRKSLEAIGINLSGGLDFSKEFRELEHDSQTVYVYNNLPRAIFEKIRIEDVAILMELQNEYLGTQNPELENIDFLKYRLRKIGITDLDYTDLKLFIELHEITRETANLEE